MEKSVLTGIIMMIIGIILILTIFGAFLGIPLLFAGAIIISVDYYKKSKNQKIKKSKNQNDNYITIKPK